MAIKDILLALISYPNPSPVAGIEQAVSFAAAVDSRITAVTFEPKIRLTRSNNFLANLLLDLPEMLSEEKSRSAANAQKLLQSFKAIATRLGAAHDEIIAPCVAFQVPDILVDHARLRDLTIIPLQEGETIEKWYAETVVFGSGRPTMVLPPSLKKGNTFELKTVTVAWDFSRAAARALSDALPLLENAKVVRIVTVKNEKEITTTHSHEQLSKYLAHHNINVILDIVDAQNRSIGDTLSAYLESCGADLLVMGAYGHSRAREFILGGATMSMLAHPPIPILLSH
jgi:nucleotide-binding universal stress UspA family protein